MSKNLLIVVVSALILVASIGFTITQKRAYNKSLTEVQEQISEIKSVAALQDLWKAKGIKSKIGRILNIVPNSKRVATKIDRAKATLKFINLNDRELNKLLSKLAMLPIEFKDLKITRSNQNFSMECLCVW